MENWWALIFSFLHCNFRLETGTYQKNKQLQLSFQSSSSSSLCACVFSCAQGTLLTCVLLPWFLHNSRYSFWLFNCFCTVALMMIRRTWWQHLNFSPQLNAPRFNYPRRFSLPPSLSCLQINFISLKPAASSIWWRLTQLSMHGIIRETGPYCSLRGKGCRPLITYQISGTIFRSKVAACGEYA